MRCGIILRLGLVLWLAALCLLQLPPATIAQIDPSPTPQAPTPNANTGQNEPGTVLVTADKLQVSGTIYLHDTPAPVGTVVFIHDGQGVTCGKAVVGKAGEYGPVLVYRDDPSTLLVDEGAVEGDTLTFYIDGHTAWPRKTSKDRNEWTGKDAALEVDIFLTEEATATMRAQQ